MKKISILSIMAISTLFIYDAKSASVQHAVGALVLKPIEVFHKKLLSFGTIMANSLGGTVTVTENGVSSSGVGLLDNSTAWAGELEIYGTPTTTDLMSVVQVISNPPTQLVNEDDSSQTMALSNMQIHGAYTTTEMISSLSSSATPESLGLTGDELGVVLDSEGKATLKTTGTLTVGANQAPGHYTAHWLINFVYPGVLLYPGSFAAGGYDYSIATGVD